MSVAHWRGQIERLKAELEAELQRQSTLTEKRRQVSLKARLEGGQAARLLDKYDGEATKAQRSIESLGMAIEQAAVELQRAEQAAEQAAEGERLKRLRNLAEQRVAIAPQIEAAAAKLGQLLAVNERLAKQRRWSERAGAGGGASSC
jgi:hypothetical protein